MLDVGQFDILSVWLFWHCLVTAIWNPSGCWPTWASSSFWSLPAYSSHFFPLHAEACLHCGIRNKHLPRDQGSSEPVLLAGALPWPPLDGVCLPTSLSPVGASRLCWAWLMIIVRPLQSFYGQNSLLQPIPFPAYLGGSLSLPPWHSHILTFSCNSANI